MNCRNRSALPVLALVALFALGGVGCSSDDSPTGPSSSTFAHASSTTQGGLTLTVSTPRATVAFAEEFQIRMELTNVSDTAQTLDFLRGEPARYGNLLLNIDDTDGLNHDASSEGERDVFELAAGATISATFTWDQVSRTLRRQVDAGVYQVIGVVSFDDRDAIAVRDLYVQID